MKPSQPRDFVSLLDALAHQAPDRVAYRYLGENKGITECTCAELREAAQRIAAHLSADHLRGERVLLLYPPGLEFIQGFLGCLYAGAIAVPAPPPNPLKPVSSLQRLAAIVESAKPSWALTLSGTLTALLPAAAELPSFRDVRWLATDDLAPLPFAGAARPDLSDIALIQYTSGSTSDPKGASLSHGNLMHNVAYFDEGWNHTPDSVLVNWLPAFHDLGLVYGILCPLWGGFLGIQMSPIDVVQRPLSWLQAISRHRATHSCGPNFIYELCVRKVSAAEAQALDLSSWRMALTAAEPVRAETMEQFARHFAPSGFRRSTFCPGYGLSEGTCKVAAVACDEEAVILSLRADALERHTVELSPPGPGTRKVVGCGRPGQDARIEIVDQHTGEPVLRGRVGEIWIAGTGVAQSYWNQPAASEESLRAHIRGGDDTPFLRTGDLGFLHEGQLFITGRIKDVIIIRGMNHYPQDIEQTVQEAHPSIRAGCCAAFSFEEDGEERLAVVAEVERRAARPSIRLPERRLSDSQPVLPVTPAPLSSDDVLSAVARAVAETHGLRVHRIALIRAGTIPKTTSGKIQRRACRRALFEETLDFVTDLEAEARVSGGSVRNDLRQRLTDLISDISAVPRHVLRPDGSLYTYGVDSLASVNIAYEISQMTGKDVPQGILYERDTINKLVDYILQEGGSQ